MRKILAISLALVMLFATIPMALAVNADTSKVSTFITVIGGNRGTMSTNGTDIFTVVNAAPNDTGVSIGFNASEFEGRTISKITYTFTGTATFNLGANYWFMYDSTYTTNTSAIGASKFQNGKINADTLPADAVVGAYWQTYTEGKQLILKDDRLQKVLENKFNYLYLVHARNSGCVKGDLKVTVEIEYEAAEESPLTMKSGASIRLNDQNGIRFYTQIDTAKLAELKEAGNKVELGTLIAPADLVEGELTHAIGADNYIDVAYKADEWHKGEEGVIAGSIVDIKPGNIGRAFIGIGYMKVTDTEGSEKYYYAKQDDNTRSLKSVAIAIRNENGEIYTSHKDQIDAWADAADWTK